MHTFTLFIPFFITFAQGQLDRLATGAGLKYFGVAIDNNDFSDAAYMEIASNTREFGQITPANPQKWGIVEPSQDAFSFSQAEVITGLANKNGQMLRCHNLLWHLSLPSWVLDGSWTKDSLTAVLKKHITAEASRFRGQCYAWDVVNEAIEYDGTMRKTIWSDIIGDDFIRIAFETAAAADPTAKLYYNDYQIELPGPKRDGVIKLIKSLQAAGTKIDGVGLQSHFTVGQTPSKEVQIANMEAFTALGIEVAITELDILSKLPVTGREEDQQSKDFENTVAACVAVKNCVGITMWGFSDARSWLNNPGSGEGAPCIFDGNLNRKPAYFGVVAGLSTPPDQAMTPQSTSTTPSSSQAPTSTSVSTTGSASSYGLSSSSGTGAPLSTPASSGASTTSSSSSPSSATTPVVFPLLNATPSTTFSTMVSPTSSTTQGPYAFSNPTTSPNGTLVSGGNAGLVRATMTGSMSHPYHYHPRHGHGHPSSTAIAAEDGTPTSSVGGSTTIAAVDASSTSAATAAEDGIPTSSVCGSTTNAAVGLSVPTTAGIVHDAGCRCSQCLGT